MRTTKLCNYYIFCFAKCFTFCYSANRKIHFTACKLCQCVEPGLNVSLLPFKNKIIRGCQWSCIKTCNENIAWLFIRYCNHIVRALFDQEPHSCIQNGFFNLLGGE